jgi:protein phosphatase PTC2/3
MISLSRSLFFATATLFAAATQSHPCCKKKKIEPIAVSPISEYEAQGLGFSCGGEAQIGWACAQNTGPQGLLPMEDEIEIVIDVGQRAEHAEDEESPYEGVAFLAVFDGHRGRGAAQFAKQGMLKTILETTPRGSALCGSIEESFACLDLQFRNHNSSSCLLPTGQEGSIASVGNKQGTTATVAFVSEGNKEILTANVGDSRAIACSAQGPRRLSCEHTMQNPAELERVANWGEETGTPGATFRNRVCGELAITRTIGDWGLKSCGSGGEVDGGPLLSTPHQQKTTITPNIKLIILATDGLWNFVDDEAVSASALQLLSAGASAQEISLQLARMAISAGSNDNIAIVVYATSQALLQGQQYESSCCAVL